MNRKCGEVVLDDELIGSCSRDVNQARQTHSLRKAGKDGVVADCFACAHTNYARNEITCHWRVRPE